MSIFAKAKEAAPKTTGAKKKEKVVISVDLGDKLRDLQEARDEISVLEAKAAMLEGDIKPVARQQFIELVKREKARPESFILESNCSKMLVIMQDKYLKVTETKEQSIDQAGLSELIETKETFSFNSELLAKYEKQISDAISKIKSIPDEDKAKLIEAKVEKVIKKGTLDRLPQFKDVEQVFNLVEPVCQLKNQ
ncbi:MAG: hypothetical protein KBG19_04295 [Bacteroidales bacterium]|nr:hypothetical protein [Bacteroidales bacterium]